VKNTIKKECREIISDDSIFSRKLIKIDLFSRKLIKIDLFISYLYSIYKISVNNFHYYLLFLNKEADDFLIKKYNNYINICFILINLIVFDNFFTDTFQGTILNKDYSHNLNKKNYIYQIYV
jgi:hypothetical protein